MARVTRKLTMTQAAYIDSRVPNTPHPLNSGDTILLHRDDENGERSRLFLSFASWPSSLKRKKLVQIVEIGVDAGFWFRNEKCFVLASSAAFNKSTLTWNNRPDATNPQLYEAETPAGSSYSDYDVISSTNLPWTEHPQTLTAIDNSQAVKAILRYSSLCLYPNTTPEERTVFLMSGNYSSTSAPYLLVEYDNGADLKSQITGLSNTSGYVNPDVEQVFRWDFLSADANYVCSGDFAQASASFFWKEHTAGTYTEVQASGSTKSVTLTAGTLPGGTQIDWYVSGTDEDGTTTTSSVYTISTSDETTYATALSPINTVEDGGAPITFRWNLANAYGNSPSLIELLWKLPSEGSQSWHELVSSSDPIDSYTVSGGTFPAGEIQWLVRAYNQDDVAGPDSVGTFISVAAPAAPDGISSDGMPYATIVWQCAGQQAYEVTVDGISCGVRFGTSKSLTLDEPLSDGEHTVTIRAQGVYGLWSEPGTGVITIQNTQGDGITLSGDGDLDAILTWTCDDEDKDFFIYRDEVKIGHTGGLNFVDRLALGTHSYYVVNRLPDGNYTKSDSVSVTTAAEEPVIAAFPPQSWMSIRLSETTRPEQSFSYQKTTGMLHVYGAAYPVAEISPFDNATATYNTAFVTAAEARAFETLKGKVVCVKSRMGIVFVGILNNLRRTVNPFYTAYSFTLTRTDWEDFIDDTLY